MSYYPPPDKGGHPEYSSPPRNHLVWAILTTIFCCLPAGIVSIVYAAQVNSKWKGGDYQGAMKASKNARTWAIVSAVIGIVLGGIYAILYAAGFNDNGMQY